MNQRFGPKNAKEAEVFAVERLRVDVQHALQMALAEMKLSQSDLAGRLEITEAAVSQMLSERANLTLRTVARAFHAIGLELGVAARRSGIVPRVSDEDYSFEESVPQRSVDDGDALSAYDDAAPAIEYEDDDDAEESVDTNRPVVKAA